MERLNELIFQFIAGPAGHHILLDEVAVFFAQTLLYFLIGGAIYLIFSERDQRKRWLLFSKMALAALLSRGIVATALHYFYQHPRPFAAYGFQPLIPESGNSFPSGHMSFLWALAMVVFFYNKKWGLWYFLLSLVMGVARIYAGVHWPLDILGGILLGILCALLTELALPKQELANSGKS